MKVIVCVDDNYGMLFNKRRQSKDKLLRKDILNGLEGKKLYVNEYSSKQFEEDEKEFLTVDEDFMEQASSDDFCFVENISLLPYEKNITELIIYKWNRKYPADVKMDIDLSKWELISMTEFPGSSHDKITKEIYRQIR